MQEGARHVNGEREEFTISSKGAISLADLGGC